MELGIILITLLVCYLIYIAVSKVIQNIKQQQEDEENRKRIEELQRKPTQYIDLPLSKVILYPHTYSYNALYNKTIVKITDKMVVGYNDAYEKRCTLYLSTGNGKYDYSINPSIDLYYGNIDQVEKLIMLNDYEKMIVQGKISVDDSGRVCVTATNLTWWNWKK